MTDGKHRFAQNERLGKIFGGGGIADRGGGRFVMVGFWQGLAGAVAGGHQLFQGRFQFSFSRGDLPDNQRGADPAAVAV